MPKGIDNPRTLRNKRDIELHNREMWERIAREQHEAKQKKERNELPSERAPRDEGCELRQLGNTEVWYCPEHTGEITKTQPRDKELDSMFEYQNNSN